MEILFRNDNIKPIVSLVLLDWSCRDSFHVLHYLSKQTVSREKYEIIWIEYYDRRSLEIKAGLEECKREAKPPIVDKWIVMDMSNEVCYHKHLMYNIGIIASKGKIVTICDSDVVVTPNLIESIIKMFEENSDIVLHLDEVRNTNKKFYPFNYPSVEEIISQGSINFKNGKTIGILDTEDPIHTRNYGACMSALREDLINIGGADEHIDYLGHVCGPYEMTFRLVNAGKREVWHQEEFLYHTWHPGTDGQNNYMGPNDGRNMSTPALEAIRTKRVMPIVENPAIRTLRLKEHSNVTEEGLLSCAIQDDNIKNWTIDENKRLISLGRASYYRGEYEEALRYWDMALKKLDCDDKLLNDRAWAYYFKSKYKESIKLFDKIIRKNPKNHSALRGRGWAYLQTANYDAAIQDLTKALEYINPDERDALQEALRGIGWAYFHKEKYEKAIQFFNNIIEGNLSDTQVILQDIFRGLGWSYYRKGNYAEAINNFKSALLNIDSANKEEAKDAQRGLDLAREMQLDKGTHTNSLYETRLKFISTNMPFTELGVPEIIEIEPILRCNLRCIQCHMSYQKLSGEMLDLRFLKHLKGLEEKWVVLGSKYEPLTHPKFCDLMHALSDFGMKIDLITNGTLFSEAISNRLVNCNFYNITVSFDGIRKGTYESIRRNAHYEETINRVMNFRNKLANKKTYFIINNTLMKRNIDELIEAVDFWEKQEFNHMGLILMEIRNLNEILKMESLENVMDDVCKKFEEAALHIIRNNYKISVSGAVFRQLSELRAKYPHNFVGSCVKSNNPQAQTPFNPKEFIQNGFYPDMPVKCRSPFKFARILYDGNVDLCYQFPVGNIYENDFLDIWYGEKAQGVRKQLMRNPNVCYACDYYRACIKAGELDY